MGRTRDACNICPVAISGRLRVEAAGVVPGPVMAGMPDARMRMQGMTAEAETATALTSTAVDSDGYWKADGAEAEEGAREARMAEVEVTEADPAR